MVENEKEAGLVTSVAVERIPESARSALERFDSIRRVLPSLEAHRERLSSALSEFVRDAARERASGDPFIRANLDTFESIARSVRATIGTLDKAIDAIREADARLEAAGRNAGLGFPPLLFATLVVAALAAGGASIGAYQAIDEHNAEQKALRNQLRDLRERCAKGQASRATCDEMIPKLEAAISENPLERVSTTAQRVLWAIVGLFALSVLLKALRKG